MRNTNCSECRHPIKEAQEWAIALVAPMTRSDGSAIQQFFSYPKCNDTVACKARQCEARLLGERPTNFFTDMIKQPTIQAMLQQDLTRHVCRSMVFDQLLKKGIR